METVTSSDGTRIGFTTVGAGPGLVLVPGALAVAADLAALASALGATFTVHVIERRGRGASGPQGGNYAIERECEDLGAVRAATGAALVFGHSFGGLVALEAAIGDADVRGVAVYEPGVSIDGSVPIGWADRCEAELDAGRADDAFVTFVRGIEPRAGRGPRWLFKSILAVVVRGRDREQKLALLRGTIAEHREVARLDGTAERYRQISGRVVLLHGSGDSGRATQALARLLPDATAVSLDKADHFAPERDPERVAECLRSAFAGLAPG